MNKSESIVELAKALSKFQGEVKQPKKDKTNPHFKSDFVSLDGVVAAITETSSKYGLSFVQFPVNNGEQVGVYTVIMHDSGEWIQSEPIFTNIQKKDPQGVGAALTYMRRYSLSAVFGITSELDDDAEGAINRGSNQQQPQYQPQYQQQPQQPYYEQAQPQYQQQQYQQQPQQSTLITEPQIKLLSIKLKACGGSDEQMLAVYNNALQNLGIAPGTSRKELTKQQASKVIDYLTNIEPTQ